MDLRIMAANRVRSKASAANFSNPASSITVSFRRPTVLPATRAETREGCGAHHAPFLETTRESRAGGASKDSETLHPPLPEGEWRWHPASEGVTGNPPFLRPN